MNAVTEVMDELRKALTELEDCRARNADLRTMLEQVTRERDQARDKHEALAVLVDGYRRERDEARAELSKLRKDYDSVLEANVGLLDGAPYVDAREAFRCGAEAMREACQQWCRAWENDGEAIADALADLRVEE